jgi:hypothetical protein
MSRSRLTYGHGPTQLVLKCNALGADLGVSGSISNSFHPGLSTLAAWGADDTVAALGSPGNPVVSW